jgi:hypothetical protein
MAGAQYAIRMQLITLGGTMAILTIRGDVPTYLKGAANTVYPFVTLADTDGMPCIFVRVRVEYGETPKQAAERAKWIAEMLTSPMEPRDEPVRTLPKQV